jgi:poly-gamma-glutamate synthesis protein (capsule biosynthesis protein)
MHTGTFKDSLQKARLHPLFVEKNKIKFGFLNYTYGTNSYKTQRPNIVNYIDTSNIRRDIQLCKTQQADIIIVTIHWGTEYERYPDKEQQDIAELVRKCGANAVIGSHPHVIQPIKLFQNIHDSAMIFPVVFSLGNFVSNQRDRYRDGGIIFELDIEKTNTTKIKSCSYLPIWVYKGNINGKLSYKLISPDKFNSASNTLKFGETDSLKCQVFFNDTRLHLNNIPETGTEKWSYLMAPRQ